MTIIIYLSGKYAASHHMVDLVGTAANVQTPAYNKAVYTQTLFNRATTYYNLIPSNNFY